MQQIPFWEANRFSARQEIPRILRKSKVHYRIHNSSPYVPITIQVNPLHALLKITFNIILISRSRSFKGSLSLRFHQNPVYTTPVHHMCKMHRQSFLLLLIYYQF
jgi:hypothetical protein